MYWARIRFILAATARKAEKTNLQKQNKKNKIKGKKGSVLILRR